MWELEIIYIKMKMCPSKAVYERETSDPTNLSEIFQMKDHKYILPGI